MLLESSGDTDNRQRVMMGGEEIRKLKFLAGMLLCWVRSKDSHLNTNGAINRSLSSPYNKHCFATQIKMCPEHR